MYMQTALVKMYSIKSKCKVLRQVRLENGLKVQAVSTTHRFLKLKPPKAPISGLHLMPVG